MDGGTPGYSKLMGFRPMLRMSILRDLLRKIVLQCLSNYCLSQTTLTYRVAICKSRAYCSLKKSFLGNIKKPKRKNTRIFSCVFVYAYVGGTPIRFTTLQLSSLKFLEEEEGDWLNRGNVTKLETQGVRYKLLLCSKCYIYEQNSTVPLLELVTNSSTIKIRT